VLLDYLDILEAQLEIDEGKRNKMYLDSKGIPTIGIGHNLRDNPISDMAVRVIFEDDVANAEADARKLFPCFDDLTTARKAVIINMMFNMGYETFSQFHHTIEMINSGNYDAAASGMLQSAWANQVGQRANRLADAMRNG
jgi:lysozyme